MLYFLNIIISLSLFFLYISIQLVFANEECITIENDLDRLACYDKKSGRTVKIVDMSNNQSNWSVRSETSKLTDQTNVFLSLVSEEAVNCGWNQNNKIKLIIRCMDNTTSMMFVTDCHMTSSQYTDYGHVTYRIDKEKAKVARMKDSTDNKALGLWSGGKSIPIIKSMVGKHTLLAKMTPYSESPFTVTFDISGLEQAVKPLKNACGW